MTTQRLKTRQALIEERFGRSRQGGVQQNTAATINDPYIKSIVEKYQHAPHYGPAHANGSTDPRVASNTEIEVDMAMLQQAIMRKQQEFQSQTGASLTADEALGSVPPQFRAAAASIASGQFASNHSMKPAQPTQPFLPGTGQAGQRQDSMPQAMQQAAPLPGMPQPHQQAQQSRQVQLKEGFTVYHVVQQGFGSGLALVKPVGSVSRQLAEQILIMQSMVEAYVVHPHQQSINLQEAERNKVKMFSIAVPPMISPYPLLVEQAAIVAGGQQPQQNGRQLITDSRAYRQPQPQRPQPQHVEARPNQPGMLRETPWRR